MKKINIVLLLLFTAIACERDDICDPNTQTTPQIVIDFFDFGSPQTPRNLIDLKVIAEGSTDTLLLGGTRFESSDTRIKLPLRTSSNTTKYKLILNGNSTLSRSIDEMTFNYSTRNEFVNRACGFKTLFNLNESDAVLLNNQSTITNGNWIRNYIISTKKIDNEIETHIKIFF
jgi:hypothetical protein